MSNLITALIIGACLSLPASAIPAMQATHTDQERAIVAIERIDLAYPHWADSYRLNEFDCSEMSAYVSDYLTRDGIENEIKVGVFPEWSHAWVELTDGTIIECTRLIVYADDKTYCFQGQPFIKDYTKARILPKTVCTDTEWDWWNSPHFK